LASPDKEGPVGEDMKPKPGADFAGSLAKPEDFMCFGTIDPDHPECKECPLRDKCAAESSQ